MIKLAAFDLDGTVGDTLPLCIASFKLAMQTYTARMLTDEDIVQTFGLNEEGMARQIVAEGDLPQALNDFYSIYERLHKTMCPAPFAGIRELIAGLRRKNIVVALVTGKGRKSCDITLRQFNMQRAFDVVLTGNVERNVKSESLRELSRSFHLPASEMAYVGDTLSDIAECRKADVRCLSAAWNNPSSDADLERENAGNVFRSISALSEYLMSII